MSVIVGKSVENEDRKLDVRPDPSPPTRQPWVLLTVHVGDKPVSVRVPIAALRGALFEIAP